MNEKAAMEVGAGAAYGRCTDAGYYEAVGLNVASDPLMSLAYMGVKGGMVIGICRRSGPYLFPDGAGHQNIRTVFKLPGF